MQRPQPGPLRTVVPTARQCDGGLSRLRGAAGRRSQGPIRTRGRSPRERAAQQQARPKGRSSPRARRRLSQRGRPTTSRRKRRRLPRGAFRPTSRNRVSVFRPVPSSPSSMRSSCRPPPNHRRMRLSDLPQPILPHASPRVNENALDRQARAFELGKRYDYFTVVDTSSETSRLFTSRLFAGCREGNSKGRPPAPCTASRTRRRAWRAPR